MKQQPLVSIIIVNYNGKQYLEHCLPTLFDLKFPKDKFEVIVVDNNSTDLSRTFLKKKYPEVVLIESAQNLGFSGGNNLGAQHARGKYMVLLNNDTLVKQDWLTYLVDHISTDEKIGAVNSKLLRYQPFVELTVRSDMYTRAEFSTVFSQETVGVLIEHILLEDTSLQPLIHYRSGVYSEEKGPIRSRWTKGEAKVLIPCDPAKKNLSFFITIHSKKFPSSLKTRVELELGKETVATDVLEAHQVKQYEVTVPLKKLEKSFLYQVQNAGNIIFKLGAARDRGAATKGDYQTYEIDSPYFNKPADVPAFCGASVIMRTDVFNKLGGFDDSFFMYYEDIDLSLRMKLMGYHMRYEPKSVVLHHHAGSSKEWSSFFVFNVEKNFLAVLIKHYPISIILVEFIRYLFMTGLAFLRMIRWRVVEHWELFEEWKDKFKVRMEVINWILRNFLQLARKRVTLEKTAKIPMRVIYKTLY